MSRIIYILFIVLGGASAAVQSPVNSGLGKRIGVFEGGFWSFAFSLCSFWPFLCDSFIYRPLPAAT